jgi:thiol:disulfide interchange protein DsbC
MIRKLSLLALALTFSAVTMADEADIKRAMEARLGSKVESVTKTGFLGLYEVYAGGGIIYTDEKMTAMIIGGDQIPSQFAVNLIDLKANKNITEDRMKKLTAIKFADLPLERAVKQVRGDGKRVLVTFEDPNCGYCKRLAKDLMKVDNVTIYTFLYPILSEDSVHKSRQIWCSADRARAWNDWMIDGKAPATKEDCADVAAVAKNQEFGRKYSITGTPTLFFADGERVPGAVPLAKIEQKLSQTK